MVLVPYYIIWQAQYWLSLLPHVRLHTFERIYVDGVSDTAVTKMAQKITLAITRDIGDEYATVAVRRIIMPLVIDVGYGCQRCHYDGDIFTRFHVMVLLILLATLRHLARARLR